MRRVAGVRRGNLFGVGGDGDVVLAGCVVGLFGVIAAEDEIGKVERAVRVAVQHVEVGGEGGHFLTLLHGHVRDFELILRPDAVAN